MLVEYGHRLMTEERHKALTDARDDRYILKDGDLYLHWSCTKLTAKRAEAWDGTHRQLVGARTKYPLAAQCKPFRIKKPTPAIHPWRDA